MQQPAYFLKKFLDSFYYIVYKIIANEINGGMVDENR